MIRGPFALGGRAETTPPAERSDHLGWIVGFVILIAVALFGAGLWFAYHP
ncbi:MAG: hypothetical protein L3K15_07435 [Thermoplasmata archaeon]|nr:hypothetical protein [Thermoplasmata archaeon]